MRKREHREVELKIHPKPEIRMFQTQVLNPDPY